MNRPSNAPQLLRLQAYVLVSVGLVFSNACGAAPSAGADLDVASDALQANADGASSRDDASAPSAIDADDVDSAPNDASGTLGSTSFFLASGAARVGFGSIDLFLSNQSGLCSAVSAGKARPGELLLQIYALGGTIPGVYTSDETKFAKLEVTCPSSSLAVSHVAEAGRATAATVEISSVTGSTVSGSLDLHFDAGTVKGHFSVPVCTASPTEALVCL